MEDGPSGQLHIGDCTYRSAVKKKEKDTDPDDVVHVAIYADRMWRLHKSQFLGVYMVINFVLNTSQAHSIWTHFSHFGILVFHFGVVLQKIIKN